MSVTPNSQTAEKLLRAVGRGFIPGIKPIESTRALAPEEMPSCSLFPVPCSLFPVPCSLFPVPCSLFPVPCSLFPIA
jgi:hypothetical protein